MKPITNDRKGIFGEKFVADYLTLQGYRVSKSPDNGSDLIAQKGKKKFSIEVKTSGNLKGGIPDMHSTEFYEKDDKWFFVADFLYVVRLDNKGEPIQLDVLSKKEIDSLAHHYTTVIRIRTRKLGRTLFNGHIGKSVQLKKAEKK